MKTSIFNLVHNRRAAEKALAETPRGPRFPGDTSDLIRCLIEGQIREIDRQLEAEGVTPEGRVEIEQELDA